MASYEILKEKCDFLSVVNTLLSMSKIWLQPAVLCILSIHNLDASAWELHSASLDKDALSRALKQTERLQRASL